MKKLNLIFILLVCFCTTIFAQVDHEFARNQFLNSSELKGLNSTDIQSLRITSDHVSSVSGIHHLYFMQEFQGIGIYNAVGSAHFNRNRQLIQTHAAFEGKIIDRISSTSPSMTAAEAILSAAAELDYKAAGEIELIEEFGQAEQKQTYRNRTISKRDIPARLMYQPMPNGELRLAWDISVLETNEKNWWSMRVDAETGVILHKNNWMVSCNFDHDHGADHHASCNTHEPVNSCSATASRSASSSMVGGYNVYAMPLQSPADGDRTIENNPDDPTASPFGWHDTDGSAGAEFTTTQGNNAHAYDDGDNPNFSPDGTGTLFFDFPMDTIYSAGTQSESAAITNLFYWSNVIHDVWYHYGFTEAAGNFQENNYGNGGAGSDYVFAEAQDGSGTCNANFGTPSDGSNPTMQMFVCNSRDGDLDNLVVVHEYGHGISNRLTGGPAASGCLNNGEQMGEGWSDYLGLMMTLQAGDTGTDSVGVGTWLIGESINGPGIREYPYSTDLAINPHTYGDVENVVAPHGVGSVWCAMLWEMTWALIDEHGFDPDFYAGTGGNNIAMALVMEGMKLQPCSPGFVDGRDGILEADMQMYGGANQCLIIKAFAKRGLGVSADQGSSSSRSDNTEAFDFTVEPMLTKTVDKLIAEPSDTLTYVLKIKNPSVCADTVHNLVLTDSIPTNTFYVAGSATNGGSESGGVVTFPAIVTMYPGDSIERSFKVYIDTAYTLAADFEDNIESGAGNWTTSATGSNNWAIVTTNPNSGTNSWFAEDFGSTQAQYLQLNTTITPTNSTQMSFWHNYDTEAGWDGGVVQYSLDGGTNWLDLGPFMTQNGYNSTIDGSGATSKPGFSGNSGGYIETRIDLSSFDGQNLDIRFWMSCDASVSGNGWYVDDVSIKSNFIDNTAYVTADGGLALNDQLDSPTEVQYLQCINGIQDGDETGIDCGGTFCPPCPTCVDGIQNGDETGVDCGGPDCPVCPTCDDGIQNQDETGIDCGGAICPACPTCDDGIQNGDETDIDCGGTLCPACPTCEDGIENGNETGIDCGGPDCPECICDGNSMTLSITLDNFPQETSWALEDSLGNILESGGTYPTIPDGTTITFDLCVPDGCYEFFMYDSYGDGICCSFGSGSYSLISNADSAILASGGDFNFADSTDFCITAPMMGGCDSLLEANGMLTSGTYHAENILMSDGTVANPDSVIFKAGQEINLNPNFEVELGAQFSAEIEACMAAMNLIRAKKAQDAATKEKSLLKKE